MTPAHDVVGRTLDGSASVTPVATAGSPTLVAFLSSGCLTCRTFWDGLRTGAHEPMPGEARVVVVTKDAQFESPSRLRDLAPDDVPVLQSSQAWGDYGITMSPYFVMVGRRRRGPQRGGREQLGAGPIIARRRDRRRSDRARTVRRCVLVTAAYLVPVVAVALAAAAALDVVTLRHVDAGKHHPARAAGTRVPVLAHRHGLHRVVDDRGGVARWRCSVRSALQWSNAPA